MRSLFDDQTIQTELMEVDNNVNTGGTINIRQGALVSQQQPNWVGRVQELFVFLYR